MKVKCGGTLPFHAHFAIYLWSKYPISNLLRILQLTLGSPCRVMIKGVHFSIEHCHLCQFVLTICIPSIQELLGSVAWVLIFDPQKEGSLEQRLFQLSEEMKEFWISIFSLVFCEKTWLFFQVYWQFSAVFFSFHHPRRAGLNISFLVVCQSWLWVTWLFTISFCFLKFPEKCFFFIAMSCRNDHRPE